MRSLVGLAFVVAFFVACSGPSTPAQVHPGEQPPTKGPVGGAAAANAQARSLKTIEGLLAGVPIYDGDFADPYVLDLGETAYAYATNTVDANVPVMHWSSYDRAEYLGDALPELPAWTKKGLVWAPAVLALPQGGYVLYYTTVDDKSGRQCISRATANDPAGPFTDSSTSPFVCPLDLGGAIDPSLYVDSDGTAHLLYKNDGNCCGITTSLWSVPLSGDGRALASSPAKLLSADQGWERGLIEAPSMVTDGSKFYVFYSANAWDTPRYAIGYGVCDTVQGPCTKPLDHAWMTSTDFGKGPGGQEFFTAANAVWMVYHGWLPGTVGKPNGERRLYLDGLTIRDGVPRRIGRDAAMTAVAPYLAGGVAVLAIGGAALWLLVRRRRRSARMG